MKLFLGYIYTTLKLLFRCVCIGEKEIFPGWGKGVIFQLVGKLPLIPPIGKTPEHSVPLNPLVLPGAIPTSLMESFIFPDINIKGKKAPRVSTKSLLVQAINIWRFTTTKLEK